MKTTFRTMLYGIAAAAFALAPKAHAFHSGGVAECEGCHTMHNTRSSGRAVPFANGVGQGAIYLLQGSDQSSTCLNCHNSADTAPSSYHISTDDSMFTTSGSNANVADKAPVEMTPGGDFGWTKVSRTYVVRGSQVTTFGQARGHNIIASDYSYGPDTENGVAAPGGTYPASALACSSCHDPHGKYRRLADGTFVTSGLPTFASGSYQSSPSPIAGVSAVGAYRILGGAGYQPKSLTGNYQFANGNPDAVVNSTYNRSEASGQTHVAYGRGMSEWCANCHTAMLETGYVSGADKHRHPAGSGAKLTAQIVQNYNSYVSSGKLTNTDPTKAYSTLAPFELGTGDYTVLKSLAVNTDTMDQSATTSANVSCLSCHRAHASAFEFGTRFYLENEFMTIAGASNTGEYDANTASGTINAGLNVAEQTAAYYGRPATAFGPQARNYCNKCHAKD